MWYVRIPIKTDPAKTVKYWRDANGKIAFFKTYPEAVARAKFLGTKWSPSIGTAESMYGDPK